MSTYSFKNIPFMTIANGIASAITAVSAVDMTLAGSSPVLIGLTTGISIMSGISTLNLSTSHILCKAMYENASSAKKAAITESSLKIKKTGVLGGILLTASAVTGGAASGIAAALGSSVVVSGLIVASLATGITGNHFIGLTLMQDYLAEPILPEQKVGNRYMLSRKEL